MSLLYFIDLKEIIRERSDNLLQIGLRRRFGYIVIQVQCFSELYSSVRRELASESYGPWFDSLNNLKFFRKCQSSSSGIFRFMTKLAFTVALFTLAEC